MESWKHLKDPPVSIPCQGQDHLPPDQDAQGLILPGLEHFQGWNTHQGRATFCLSQHPHSKDFFFQSNLNFSFFKLYPSVPSTVAIHLVLMSAEMQKLLSYHNYVYSGGDKEGTKPQYISTFLINTTQCCWNYNLGRLHKKEDGDSMHSLPMWDVPRWQSCFLCFYFPESS